MQSTFTQQINSMRNEYEEKLKNVTAQNSNQTTSTSTSISSPSTSSTKNEVEDSTSPVDIDALTPAKLEDKPVEREYAEISDKEYEVRKIQDVKRSRRGKNLFLVSWKHYDRSQDEWVKEENIRAPEAMQAFLDRKQKKLKAEEEWTIETKKKLEEKFKLKAETKNNKSESKDIKSELTPVRLKFSPHIAALAPKLEDRKFSVKSHSSSSSKQSRIKKQNPSDNDSTDSDEGDEEKYPSDDDPSGDEAYFAAEKGDPFKELIPFLLLRQELFPIENNENMYTDRFTLLTVGWRMSEVYRFCFLCNFDVNLYPTTYQQLYDSVRIHHHLLPKFRYHARSTTKEETIQELSMTYDVRETRIKGRSITRDRDLPPNSYTLSLLPAPLRVHPPNWSTYESSHEPPTFIDLANKQCKLELEDIVKQQQAKDLKFKETLQVYNADRAAKIHGETIPKAEFDPLTIKNFDNNDNNITDINTNLNNNINNNINNNMNTNLNGKLNVNPNNNDYVGPNNNFNNNLNNNINSNLNNIYNTSNTNNSNSAFISTQINKTVEDLLKEMPDNKGNPPSHLLKHTRMVMWRSVFPLITETLREGIKLELENRVRAAGEANSFIDKTKLKKPPTPDRKFSGNINPNRSDNVYPAPTLTHILLHIARFDFNIAEAFTLIEACFEFQALIWFNNIKSNILKAKENELGEFVRLFKITYMNRTHITDFETRLRSLKQTSDTEDATEKHFNIFSTIANNICACCETYSQDSLIQMYFMSLPDSIKTALGTAAIHTCDSVFQLYTIARETAQLVTNKTNNSQRPNRSRYYESDLANTSVVNFSTHDVTYSDESESNESEYSENSDSDYECLNVVNPNKTVIASTHLKYLYPTSFECLNAEEVYHFNAKNFSNIYSKDWRCFHCGEKGHRAGMFCPVLRQGG